MSVVIPVRNGAGLIGDAIRSVLASDYEGVLEVIVAEGASTDDTRGEIYAIADGDRRVRVVNNPLGHTSTGLNAAITASSGSVIVRCDAQATLSSGYIRRAVEILERSGADIVGGTQGALGSSIVQRAIAIAMTTPLGTGGARFRVGRSAGPTDTVYLGVFRRSVFLRVGMFDETLIRNQDYELNYRVRAGGGTVYFHPDLVVAYSPRPTFGELFRQYRQYGEWKRRMLSLHPESVRVRQLVPPLFVVGLIAALVLLFTTGKVVAVAYLGLYGALLAATSLIEAVRRHDLAALVTPVALATMHLSWGFGFLVSADVAPDPVVPQLDR